MSKKSKIITAVIVVVLIIAGIYFFNKSGKTENESKNQNTETENSIKSKEVGISVALEPNEKGGKYTAVTFKKDDFNEFSEEDINAVKNEINSTKDENLSLNLNNDKKLYVEFRDKDGKVIDVANARVLIELYEDLVNFPSETNESIANGTLIVDRDEKGYYVSLESIDEYVKKDNVYPVILQFIYNYNGVEYTTLTSINLYRE